MSPKTHYKQALEKHTLLLEQTLKRQRFLSFLRLLIFLCIVVTCYFLKVHILLWVLLFAEIFLFIYVINRWLDAKLWVDKERLYLIHNRAELNALSGDWSGFDDGENFQSKMHPFSSDMDLFGHKSVFQYINRTTLPLGREKLAKTLAYGAKNKELNQAMIIELSENIGWMQDFIVESKVLLKNHQTTARLSDITQDFNEHTFGGKHVNWLRWLLPAITLSSILAYNFTSFFSFSALFMLACLVLGIIAYQLKYTNAWMHALNEHSAQMNAMTQQLSLFMQLKFRLPLAIDFQNKLKENMGILDGLKSLQQIKKRATYRMNVLVGLLLNYFFAWDLHLLVHSKSWYKSYGNLLSSWEENLAEIEVWISGGIYRYNQEKTCFSAPSKDGNLSIIGLTHPFVIKENRVENDFLLQKNESFLIITGPNMAGKSTYLRSVGLTILSANAGFPIPAQSCTLPPMSLYSSMRTSDDLTQGSSYFHAELSRLKFIVDSIDKETNHFVILDEILKGTNSRDKEIGSAKFLSKLQNIGAKGIIATHDLSLTELGRQTKHFKNVCFDSTIKNDELLFDYTIREGVCQNMNASFLLKKMGLIDP